MSTHIQFSLPATGNQTVDFPQVCQQGIWVIYFYPRDNTPGCTTESEQFRDLYPQFQALGCQIFGISRDSLKSHEKFKEKLNLPFDLLSDADEQVCQLFGVIKQKMMYGKQVKGIERSTFVYVEGGKQVKEWRGVKANGHAQQVLEFVTTLNQP